MSHRCACLALVAAVAGASLAGCALQPVPRPAALAPRLVVPAFELEGRLSATDGNRAGSGALRWSHSPTTDEWTVLNPLGQIVGQLVATPQRARLRTADGRTEQAADAAAMLSRLLGVSAPLGGLSYWVQAAPRPGARVLDIDAMGRPARISDDGWIIDYPEYAGTSADAPPRRIDASWGDARIRLLIDRCTPLP